MTGGWGPAGITAPNVNLPLVNLVIPAGGQVKRHMFRASMIQGFKTSFTWSSVLPWAIAFNVTISAGQYSPRTVFSTIRDIPYTLGTFSELGVANYEQYFHGGDNEFGWDEKSTYGTATGPGMTWTLTASGRSSTSSVNLGVTGQFAVLYYL